MYPEAPTIPFTSSSETPPRYQRILADGTSRNANVVAFFCCGSNLVLEIDTDRKERGQTQNSELSAFGKSVYDSDWKHAISLNPNILSLAKKLRLDEGLFHYLARSLFILAHQLLQRVSEEVADETQMNELFQLLVNELVSGKGDVFYVDRDVLGLPEKSQRSDTQYFIIDLHEVHPKINELLSLPSAPSRKSFYSIDMDRFLEHVQVSELKNGERSINISLSDTSEPFDIRPANGFTLLPYLRLRQQHGGIAISPSDDPSQFGQYDPRKMILAQCIQSAYPKEVLPPLFMTDMTPITTLLEIAECFPTLNLEDLAFDAVHPDVLVRGTLIQQIVLHISGNESLYEQIFTELHLSLKENMLQKCTVIVPPDELVKQYEERFNCMLPEGFDSSKVHYTFSRLERKDIVKILAFNRARRITIQEALNKQIHSLVEDWLQGHPEQALHRTKPDEAHHIYLTGPTAAGKSSLQAYLERMLDTPPVEQYVENNPDPYYRLMLGPLLQQVSHGLAFGSFNLSICWYMIRLPLVQAVLDAYDSGGPVPNMIYETLGLSGLRTPQQLLNQPGKHTIVVVSADAGDKAVERAILRGDVSGRYVAADVVKESYKNVSRQFIIADNRFDLREFIKTFLVTENHQLLVCDSGCLYPTPIRINKEQEGTRRSVLGDRGYIPAAIDANPIIMIIRRDETQILDYPRLLSFLGRSGFPVNQELIERFLVLIPGTEEQKMGFRTKLSKTMNAVPTIQRFVTPFLTRDANRRRVQSQLADFVFANPGLVAESLSVTARFILAHFDFTLPDLGAYARQRQLNHPGMSGRSETFIETDEQAVAYLKEKVQMLSALTPQTSITPEALSQGILALYTTARMLGKQESFKALWKEHSKLSGYSSGKEKAVIPKNEVKNPSLRTQTGIQLKSDPEAQRTLDHRPSSLKLTTNPNHSNALTYFDTAKRPFVAGPSGHTTYYLFPLRCMQQENGLSDAIARQYLLAIGSMLVRAGAHSLEEVADTAQRFFPELLNSTSNVYQAFLGTDINHPQVLSWIKADRHRIASIQPPAMKQAYARYNSQRFMRQDTVAFMRRHPGLIASLAPEKALTFIENWRRRFESDLGACIKAQRQTFHPVIKRMNQLYIDLLEHPSLFPQSHECYRQAIERFFLNRNYMGSVSRVLKNLDEKETLIQLLKESYLPDDSLMLLHYGLLRYVYELCPELKGQQKNLLKLLQENSLAEGGAAYRTQHFDRQAYVPGIVIDPDELRDIKPLAQPFLSMAGSTEPAKGRDPRDLELGIPYVGGPSGHMAMYLIGYQLVIELVKKHAPDALEMVQDRKTMQLYLLRWMANILVSGSHSIDECARVLADIQAHDGEVYFPYKNGSYAELLQLLQEYDWFQTFFSDGTQNYQWLMSPNLDEHIDNLLRPGVSANVYR
ncbi:TPA: hypothetical protein ACT9LE_002730 [Legionella pneumophila]